MAAKFTVAKSKNGKFHFNLKAANGEVILSSEMYSAKTDAMKGIDSVRKHAKSEKNFTKKATNKGEPYFVLNATNGQVIGKSEMYSSASSMGKGMKSVARNAVAKIADTTEM